MLNKANWDSFSNYRAFSSHFAPLDIYRERRKDFYMVCPEGKAPEANYIQTGTMAYINGWLYGAVQAVCGQIRRKSDAIEKNRL